MKKQWNGRLEEVAIQAIKRKALEWDCSAAEVVERMVLGVGSEYKVTAVASSVTSPQLDKKGEAKLAIQGPDKRAVFEALKGKFGGDPDHHFKTLPEEEARRLGEKEFGPGYIAGLSTGMRFENKELHEVARAPFDVNVEGEPHRVTLAGKKLGLYYIGGGEPVFSRYLGEGEFEKLWEQRVK